MTSQYVIRITDREDGLAYVGCDKPIPGVDAETIITHLLMSSWATEGSDPFILLCRALGRCDAAMDAEWKDSIDTRGKEGE